VCRACLDAPKWSARRVRRSFLILAHTELGAAACVGPYDANIGALAISVR